MWVKLLPMWMAWDGACPAPELVLASPVPILRGKSRRRRRRRKAGGPPQFRGSDLPFPRPSSLATRWHRTYSSVAASQPSARPAPTRPRRRLHSRPKVPMVLTLPPLRPTTSSRTRRARCPPCPRLTRRDGAPRRPSTTSFTTVSSPRFLCRRHEGSPARDEATLDRWTCADAVSVQLLLLPSSPLRDTRSTASSRTSRECSPASLVSSPRGGSTLTPSSCVPPRLKTSVACASCCEVRTV